MGLLIGVVALAGFAATYSLACRGELTVYSRLAAAEHSLAPPAARGTPGDDPPVSNSPDAGQVVRDSARGLVSAVLSFKQSDAVAYPLHTWLALLLDRTGCAPEAVRQQWLKAAMHAQGEGQVAAVVAALREGIVDDGDAASLQAMIDALARAESWSVGLQRVRAELSAISTP
jgi:hypothetical protein